MPKPTPETMRAAAIDAFGGVDQIKMRTLPVPTPDAGEVLIRVEAAGLASWDKVEREGAYDGAFGFPSTFPYVLGWDGAGVIEAVGDQVRRFKVGDRVYAASMPLPKGGFHAEYAVVSEDHAALIPKSLGIEAAAAMPWDALTAQSGLEALELQGGETLMVFGASGGIGHMAVQLAKRRGVRVFAVASGEDGVALVQKLGADTAIDGRKQDVVQAARAFAPNGIDAALVTAGGAATELALTALRGQGRIACPNGVTPVPQGPPGARLHLYDGDRTPAGTDKLNQILNSGPFTVHVARVFDLDDAAEAHRMLETHYVGKIALRVGRS